MIKIQIKLKKPTSARFDQQLRAFIERKSSSFGICPLGEIPSISITDDVKFHGSKENRAVIKLFVLIDKKDQIKGEEFYTVEEIFTKLTAA